MSLEAGDHGTSATDGQSPGGPGLAHVVGVPPPHLAHTGELPLEGVLAVCTGVMVARVYRVERGGVGARPGSCCQERWRGWGFTGDSLGKHLLECPSLVHAAYQTMLASFGIPVSGTWSPTSACTCGMPMGCAWRLSGKLFVVANWTLRGTASMYVACLPCS